MTTDTCRKCGTSLTSPATGRPPTYCGTGCRRAAEHEIRRLSRHLERLALDASKLRIDLASEDHPATIDRLSRRLDAYGREIDAADVRLRLLLDEPE